ncbi:MAG: TetR/AcrR family transcriptional regulator [Pseudomonadota bacterium]
MNKTPTETERTIVEAAIKRFLRYGARKTSMNDIADEANVSRQTLYDLFDGKDDLICASIRSITDKSIADIREKTADLSELGDQLDVYFTDNIVRSFEMMTVSDDPQDLVTGHNEAGKAEIANSRRKHEALISEWFEPYATAIEEFGHSVGALAHYFVTVAMALKYEAKDRKDLDALWQCHRTMVLRAAERE